MLLIVLQSAVALSVLAVAVGSTVGLIAKRRSWSATRTLKGTYFGFNVSLFVSACSGVSSAPGFAVAPTHLGSAGIPLFKRSRGCIHFAVCVVGRIAR
jgi:hypothetical protein